MSLYLAFSTMRIAAQVKHFSTCGTLLMAARQESQGATAGVRLPRGYGYVGPYAIFFKENYQQGTKVIDAAKRTAQLWKALSETDKQQYKTKAAKATKERLANYNSLSEKDRNQLKVDTQERKTKSLKLAYRKEIKELGRPKQTGNAYSLYVAGVAKGAKSIQEGAEQVKKAALVWNAMSAKEREPYVTTAETNKKKFDEELKKWEASMHKMGKSIPIRPTKRSLSAGPSSKPTRRLTSAGGASKKKAAGVVRPKKSAAGRKSAAKK